jgi:hypothetical protein
MYVDDAGGAGKYAGGDDWARDRDRQHPVEALTRTARITAIMILFIS